MKFPRSKQTSFARLCLLGSLPALGILTATAATVTWTGGGADSNWNTAGNWTSGVPADGDELVFPNSASGFDVALNGTYSPAKLRFTSTGTQDYSVTGTGTLAGTGVTIQKDGDAWLTFGGNNTFTGQVLINGGILKLATSSDSISYALGATGNTLKIAAGATLDLNGQGPAVHATVANRRYHSVELAGNGVETSPGVFAGAITSSVNLAFIGRGKSGLQNLVMTGDASVGVPSGVAYDLGFGSTGFTSGSVTSSTATVRTLSKTGPGTLHLAGTNTGVNLRVREGVLTGYSTTAFGDKLIIDSGASARSWASGTFTVPVDMADGASLANSSSPITFSGIFTIAGTPTFTTFNTQPLTIGSTLNAPADVKVDRIAGQAGSTVIFTGDNTLVGGLFLGGDGVAQLGNGGTTGSFKNASGSFSPIDLGGAGTLIINRSDDFTFDAPVTGTGSLTKNGTGTLRRTVEAGFSRPGGFVATVSGGTLLVNNTVGFGIGEGTVSVGAAATLGGTGSIAGPVSLGSGLVTAARAFLAPGDGPGKTGTFTTGNVILPSNSSATIQIEVNGTAADKLVINGNLVLGPGKIAELALQPFGSGATLPSYTLIEYTGELQGTFNSITGLPVGYRIRHDSATKRVVLEQSSETSLQPQILYWDGGTTDIAAVGDGASSVAAGNWNNTLKNWDQGAVAHLPWANDGSATAIVATGAYTITLDAATPLSVAGIRRIGTTASLTLITGGTIQLQPAAPLHDGHFGTSDQGLRIASKLTGTGGFSVSGRTFSGTNLSRVSLLNPVPGDNTITGPVSITSGHLRLAANQQLGDSAVVTLNTLISGATATLETASDVNETVAGLNFGSNGGELKLGGTGVSELTLNGGGLSIADGATFTYGNSASGIRFANAGDLVKSGDTSVTIGRVNPANFIDLGGSRTIRVNGFGNLDIAVNLTNGALFKQGEGMLILSSDANTYAGSTTVAEGTVRLTHPGLNDNSTLQLAPAATLDLAFATEEITDTVKVLIVGGQTKPAGLYGPVGTSIPGVTPLAQITGSGLIRVVPGSASPFDAWAAQISDPAKRGKTADPDGDGINNFTEFAFDGNPSSGAASGKIEATKPTLGGEQTLVITLPVRTGAGAFTADGRGLVSTAVDGVIYRIQGSADLTSWNLPLAEVTGTSGIAPPSATLTSGAWEYRSFRLTGSLQSRPKAFLRATVTEP